MIIIFPKIHQSGHRRTIQLKTRSAKISKVNTITKHRIGYILRMLIGRQAALLAPKVIFANEKRSK